MVKNGLVRAKSLKSRLTVGRVSSACVATFEAAPVRDGLSNGDDSATTTRVSSIEASCNEKLRKVSSPRRTLTSVASWVWKPSRAALTV
jgi:hypothetical protein